MINTLVARLTGRSLMFKVLFGCDAGMLRESGIAKVTDFLFSCLPIGDSKGQGERSAAALPQAVAAIEQQHSSCS